MQEFMRGLLDAGVLRVLDLQVFDAPSLDPSSELIDTRIAWHSTQSEAAPIFTRRVLFRTSGRLWSIQFVSRPEFDAMVQGSRPWMVLVLSLAATFVLFMLTTLLVAAWNRAHDLSMRDPLTGLYNRRYLDETMGRELPRARRLGATVGVIVLDIDHFKHLNDTHGHEAGDRVLERTGDVLRAATRKGDIACRFGGEEFAVVLPGATLQVARVRAEAIREALEAMRLDVSGRPLGPLTISAGVAAMPPHEQDWSLTLRRADRALYAAKQSGRNKVMTVME
jgi:diguanylate cyclase (GGDEF)-like protein